MPVPNCRGLKKLVKRDNPKELATFEAKRLRVNPIAIGRIPPDFLSRAIRRPPKKVLAMLDGHRPARIMLVKLVRADKKSGPATLQPNKTLRCWGLRPSGPPEEPAGKE